MTEGFDPEEARVEWATRIVLRPLADPLRLRSGRGRESLEQL